MAYARRASPELLSPNRPQIGPLLFLLQRALSVFNMLAWPGLANAMLGTFRRRLPPSMAAMQRHAGRRPMLLCMATAGASTIAILAQSHANAACVSSDEEAEHERAHVMQLLGKRSVSSVCDGLSCCPNNGPKAKKPKK
jgi:hypothetical protein